MRALKALVIGLGIAVIAAAAVLATLIVERMGGLGGGDAVVARVALPEGARVAESRLDGARILLRLQLPNGDERLLILDAETGATVAAFDLVAGGRAP